MHRPVKTVIVNSCLVIPRGIEFYKELTILLPKPKTLGIVESWVYSLEAPRVIGSGQILSLKIFKGLE